MHSGGESRSHRCMAGETSQAWLTVSLPNTRRMRNSRCPFYFYPCVFRIPYSRSSLAPVSSEEATCRSRAGLPHAAKYHAPIVFHTFPQPVNLIHQRHEADWGLGLNAKWRCPTKLLLRARFVKLARAASRRVSACDWLPHR